MSKYHLSHLFSEKMGQKFLSYLSGVRVSYACKLLAETNLPVGRIMGEAGFESEATFFRAFRNQLGITPARYRKRIRAIADRTGKLLETGMPEVIVYNSDNQ